MRVRRFVQRNVTALVLTLAVFLLLCVVLPCATWVWAVQYLLSSRLDSISRRGEPINVRQLDAWYSKPLPAEDGTKDHLAALASWAEIKGLKDETKGISLSACIDFSGASPSVTLPIDPQIRHDVDYFMTLYGDTLELLHKAADHPRVRYPTGVDDLYMRLRDPRYNSMVGYNHLAALNECVYLLGLESAQHAARNESEAATGCLLDMLQWTRSLDMEPSLDAQWYRVMLQFSFRDALSVVLGRTPLSHAQLVRISEACASLERREPFVRGLVGFRAQALSAMDGEGRLSFDAMLLLDRRSKQKWLSVTGFPAIERARTIDLMNLGIEAVKGAPEELPEKIEALQKEIDALPSLYEWPRVLLRHYAQQLGSSLYATANLRCILAVLAIERYRIDHADSVPDNLTALVPKYMTRVPLDPWTGRPLCFKPLERGYVVYSVGPDRKDDGGIIDIRDHPGENSAAADSAQARSECVIRISQ